MPNLTALLFVCFSKCKLWVNLGTWDTLEIQISSVFGRVRMAVFQPFLVCGAGAGPSSF